MKISINIVLVQCIECYFGYFSYSSQLALELVLTLLTTNIWVVIKKMVVDMITLFVHKIINIHINGRS